MARPDHIPTDIWTRAAEAHARFADSRVADNLQVIIAEAMAAERTRSAKAARVEIWARLGDHRVCDQVEAAILTPST